MKKEKIGFSRCKSLFLGLISLILLLAFDQLTKYLAWTKLQGNDSCVLLPGVFELHYLQNEGAAFGMFENMQWIFVLFALIISCVAVYYYLHIPMEKHFLPLRILCVTITAGAIGNMVDRILHHYVIDFLYVSLIDFPIFNIADIYVCVSTGLFLILLLFYYKEDDFDRISGKPGKEEYMNQLRQKIEESRNEK